MRASRTACCLQLWVQLSAMPSPSSLHSVRIIPWQQLQVSRFAQGLLRGPKGSCYFCSQTAARYDLVLFVPHNLLYHCIYIEYWVTHITRMNGITSYSHLYICVDRTSAAFMEEAWRWPWIFWQKPEVAFSLQSASRPVCCFSSFAFGIVVFGWTCIQEGTFDHQ